jgi:hypothetical protein
VRAGEETRPPAVFRGARHKELRALVDQVERLLGTPDVLLVDARAPERFEGTSEPLDRTPGHIPGAVNHFYRRNVTADGVMLPPETLRRQFAETLAGRPADQVVMYCGSGVTACHNLLAMERGAVCRVVVGVVERSAAAGRDRSERHRKAVLIGRGILPMALDARVRHAYERVRIDRRLRLHAYRHLIGRRNLLRRGNVRIRHDEDLAIRPFVHFIAAVPPLREERRVRQPW